MSKPDKPDRATLLNQAEADAKTAEDVVAVLVGQRETKLVAGEDVEELDIELEKARRVAAAVEKALRHVVRLFHDIHETNCEVVAAAPLPNEMVVACALTRGGLVRAIEAELYRISGTPFIGGGQTVDKPPQFPGARCPTPTNPDPGAIEPLSKIIADAFAIARMREDLPTEEAAA